MLAACLAMGKGCELPEDRWVYPSRPPNKIPIDCTVLSASQFQPLDAYEMKTKTRPLPPHVHSRECPTFFCKHNVLRNVEKSPVFNTFVL